MVIQKDGDFFLSINRIGIGLLCIFPFTFSSMDDPMPRSSSDTNQPHLFHGYPSPFRGNYEESDPNLPYPYPTSPLRWGFFDSASLHGREELGFTCVPQIGDEEEEDQLQSNGYGSWQEDLSHYNDTWDYGSSVEKQSGCDYDPWSWVGGRDEYCHPESRVDAYSNNSNSNSDQIMGLCEGIFGYWPCLLREYEKTYDQH